MEVLNRLRLGLRAETLTLNPRPETLNIQTIAITKHDCAAAAGLIIRGVALLGLGLFRLEKLRFRVQGLGSRV